MTAKLPKNRSLEDIQMDMDAITRVMARLMESYEVFHEEREVLIKELMIKELGMRPQKSPYVVKAR